MARSAKLLIVSHLQFSTRMYYRGRKCKKHNNENDNQAQPVNTEKYNFKICVSYCQYFIHPSTDLAINGASDAVLNTTYNYSVSNSPASGISYNWNMGANATSATSTSATPSTKWTAIGFKNMSVAISNGSCVAATTGYSYGSGVQYGQTTCYHSERSITVWFKYQSTECVTTDYRRLYFKNGYSCYWC